MKKKDLVFEVGEHVGKHAGYVSSDDRGGGRTEPPYLFVHVSQFGVSVFVIDIVTTVVSDFYNLAVIIQS